jgi:hypothetical protein
MRRKAAVLLGVAAMVLTGCGTAYSIAPIADASQQVRYERGTPTTYSEKQFGAVQVTPLGVNDDNRIGFGIAVYNKSGGPANFGTENLSLIQNDGSPGKVMTSAELEHEAKVKAGWQTFAVALAGGLQAYAASRNAVSTTQGTAYTPVGPVSYNSQTYNPALAQANAEIAGAETGLALHSIQESLERRLASIHGDTLQTTTINPDESYGGIAVVDELSSSNFPQDVMLHVNWNGEEHIFRFTIVKGTDAVVRQASEPAPAPVTVAPLSAEAKLPYGHVANTPTTAQETAAPSFVSYNQWGTGDNGHANSGATHKEHRAEVIQGAVN